MVEISSPYHPYCWTPPVQHQSRVGNLDKKRMNAPGHGEGRACMTGISRGLLRVFLIY